MSATAKVVSPRVCHRVALYVGRDGWNRTRTAQLPIPDDMTPDRFVTRHGVRLELKAVLPHDEVMAAESLDALTVRHAERTS